MSTKGLFGDDDSSSSDEDEQQQPMQEGSPAKKNTEGGDDGDAEFDDRGAVVGLSSTTLAGSKVTEEPKDEEMKEQEEEIPIDPRKLVVQQVVPSLNPQELFMTKLPNLVGIQTQAFDPDTYSPGVEEDEFGPQSAFNLMRWRYNGDQQRESNTRLVQWENNSWTLHIGAEVFEVDIVDSSDKNTGFAGLNGYVYLSQKASHRKQNGDGDDDQEDTPAGTVLECVGGVNSRMIVRPSSLQSEAHKSLTVAVRQKTIKRARIAQFTTTEDPEKLKEERIRVKADLEKAAMRKSGGGGGGGYRRSGGGGRRPRMSRDYLEEDEDFDTTNIRAMKRGIYDRDDDEPDDYAAYDQDDDDEEDNTFQRVRPKDKKKSRYEDDDDEEEEMFGGDDDDDDEDEVAPMVKTNKKKAPTKSLFDDDSD